MNLKIVIGLLLIGLVLVSGCISFDGRSACLAKSIKGPTFELEGFTGHFFIRDNIIEDSVVQEVTSNKIKVEILNSSNSSLIGEILDIKYTIPKNQEVNVKERDHILFNYHCPWWCTSGIKIWDERGLKYVYDRGRYPVIKDELYSIKSEDIGCKPFKDSFYKNNLFVITLGDKVEKLYNGQKKIIEYDTHRYEIIVVNNAVLAVGVTDTPSYIQEYVIRRLD